MVITTSVITIFAIDTFKLDALCEAQGIKLHL